ncbi:IS1 family transposase, partial [Shigella sonnei]|uniref:IS1 family transposase n=1 Tax=Shigella sonnei TaxID=624 RepID=UPI00338FF968
MASVSISCPSCSATDGVVRNGKSTAGHQRYLCSHCRKTCLLYKYDAPDHKRKTDPRSSIIQQKKINSA